MTRLDLPLLRTPVPNSISLLRQGAQVLSLWNNTWREMQIQLEQTAGFTLDKPDLVLSRCRLDQEF